MPEGTYNLTIEGNEDFRFQEVSGEQNLGQFDRFVARSGDLDIETRITIIGSNPSSTIIDASFLGDRVLDVASGASLTLKNVTIFDGLLIESVTVGVFSESADELVVLQLGNIDTTPNGAAINVALGANVLVENSIISSSRSEVKGGAINNSGTL